MSMRGHSIRCIMSVWVFVCVRVGGSIFSQPNVNLRAIEMVNVHVSCVIVSRRRHCLDAREFLAISHLGFRVTKTNMKCEYGDYDSEKKTNIN